MSDQLLRAALKTDTLITSGTTIASYGKLNAEQLDKFMQWIIEQENILKMIDVIDMNGPTLDLDSFDIAEQSLRKATEGTASDAVGITTAKRSLSTTEVVLPYKPSYSFVEDNIAKRGGVDQIIRGFATLFSNDLANLAINGDGSTGNFFSIEKGFIQLIKDEVGSSHIYDHNGSTSYLSTVLPNILAELPSKFKANFPKLRFIVSYATYEAIAKEVANRSTALGDAILLEGKPLKYGGITIERVPYWPDGTHLLCDPKNLAIGVQRNILFETDKDIEKRLHIYVMTSRIDFQIKNLDSLVISYDA